MGFTDNGSWKNPLRQTNTKVCFGWVCGLVRRNHAVMLARTNSHTFPQKMLSWKGPSCFGLWDSDFENVVGLCLSQSRRPSLSERMLVSNVEQTKEICDTQSVAFEVGDYLELPH